MAFDPNKITFFARTDARGKDVQFGLKAKDRQKHVYVIGKTGMGKSTLLENMAVQDIQNGEGMAFIDPHGSAAETLLNYIPEHRINDVLYFAPFDTDHPVSFNIMEDVGPDKRHLVVSGLMSVFKKIWVDAWSARMEYILSNTLLALLEYPDSTLLGVNRMLSDKDYRRKVIDNITDPSVKSFWVDEFLKYNERYMQEAGDAIKNKIGQFTANPVIRNIIGQPKSSFDIRQIMDEKKILIMNLSKGLIGETNANLLGSMLTTRIYLAAMSRADLPPEKMRDMPNFYFFVDEFQSFANATFANILSEARKYHLNLTIAHQYIAQMEEEVRDAVFGNVGTIISFRVGPFDAEVLETIFTPQFLATDIVNLAYTQIYLTLMIDGVGSQPFSATTLPPIAPPAISYKEVAIAASRLKFSHPRAEVEAAIHKFHEPVIVPKKTESPKFPSREPIVEYGKKPEFKREPAVVPEVHMEPKKEEIKNIPRPPERKFEKLRPQHVETKNHSPEHIKYQRNEVIKPKQSSYEQQKEPYIKREQKVEDLRSILKQIVQKTDGASMQENPQEKMSARHEHGEKPELKQLLNTVLASEKEKQAMQEHVTEQPKVAPNAYGVVPPENESVTVPTQQPSEIETEKHTITPKELERMMRVTTNDKPPV